MKILVSKIGASLTGSDVGYTEFGEQGVTEGVIRHLMAQGHHVVFYGILRGSLPCKVVNADVSGLTTTSDPEEQLRRGASDTVRVREALGADRPDVYIQSTGMGGTVSMLSNPRGIKCLHSAVRYTSPILMMTKNLAAPRVLINTDFRNYPKEQEMSTMWPDELLPCALLDQCFHGLEVRPTIGFKKYVRRSAYSGCEGWGYVPEGHRSLFDAPRTRCAVMSHAHIATGYKDHWRDAAWRDVLDGFSCAVIGEGWEHYSGKEDKIFLGSYSPRDLEIAMRCYASSPLIAPRPGFITSKGHIFSQHGCVPIYYGDGEQPYTQDPEARIVPLDHWSRVSKPGDLAKVAARVACEYTEAISESRALHTPNWSKLDELLEDLPKLGSETWWERYGGYRRCTS